MARKTYDGPCNHHYLAHAFEMQVAIKFRAIDVDRRCIALLERRLFERSPAAGRASNRQWGKDVGPHQGGWSPYRGIPSFWDVHAVFYPSDTAGAAWFRIPV